MFEFTILFSITGCIAVILVLFQVAKILKVRHNSTSDDQIIQPVSTQMQQAPEIVIHTTGSEETEDRWLYTITSSLLDKVSASGERELTFIEPCSIQSLDPFPLDKENCYFEIKIIELPPTTDLIIGLSSLDSEHTRTLGNFKSSVGYSSLQGNLSLGDFPHEYGNKLFPGDVLGCGYRPIAQRVFYTRNGRRYPRVVFDHTHDPIYPTLYANGPCKIEFNFGQAGFVLTSANVRNYGLAEPSKLIIPPPCYGHHSMDMSITSPRDTISFFSSTDNTPMASPTSCPPSYRNSLAYPLIAS